MISRFVSCSFSISLSKQTLENSIVASAHKNCMSQVAQCHGYHGKPGTKSPLCLFLRHLCASILKQVFMVCKFFNFRAWKHLMPSAQKSVKFVDHLSCDWCSTGVAQRLDNTQPPVLFCHIRFPSCLRFFMRSFSWWPWLKGPEGLTTAWIRVIWTWTRRRLGDDLA